MSFNNISIHGFHSEHDKLKFIGRNAQRNVVWKTSGNMYKEVYNQLVDMGVIARCDYDPVDEYVLSKLGKTYDDYTTDEEIDFDSLYKDGDEFLTDKAYYEIISNENGNAYYQEWV